MAKKTVTMTEYTDDLDGGKADGTITFSFNGTNYEIDLSKSNARAFEKALKPYVDAARKVRATRGRGRSGSRGSGPKADLTAVRDWARENGYTVSERGRLAASVLEAYEAAH